MNRRQKKKADNIHRAKLHRILDQVLDINGLESRQKSKTGDQPTAFFWFNGNTGVTDVIVHYTGWDYDSKADFTKRVAVHPKEWHDSLDDVIKQLDYIRWIYHV